MQTRRKTWRRLLDFLSKNFTNNFQQAFMALVSSSIIYWLYADISFVSLVSKKSQKNTIQCKRWWKYYFNANCNFRNLVLPMFLSWYQQQLRSEISVAINTYFSLHIRNFLYLLNGNLLRWKWTQICNVNENYRTSWINCSQLLERLSSQSTPSSCSNDDKLWCRFLLTRNARLTLL